MTAAAAMDPLNNYYQQTQHLQQQQQQQTVQNAEHLKALSRLQRQSGLPPNATNIVGTSGQLPYGALNGLPPTIDPSLFLSFTPSPPDTPTGAPTGVPPIDLHQHHQQQQHQQQQQLMNKNKALNIDAPPSLTPSPPQLSINADKLSHQQLAAQLAAQQQTVQMLQAKLQQASQQQAEQTAQQNIAVQILQRSIANRSATPVAPLDGNMLEALLPTTNDEDAEN
eukprot:516530_1